MPTKTIKEEVAWLTLDAGARRCAEYLDTVFSNLAQLSQKVDDCCGAEGIAARPVDQMRAELAEVRAEFSKGLTELAGGIGALRKEFQALKEPVPSDGRR